MRPRRHLKHDPATVSTYGGIASIEVFYNRFMETKLPLSALLSQTYVAFVIEFDNEFERQVPHRTTNYGSTPGFPRAPWLVSMAMWVRFMRHIPFEGVSAANLQAHLAISKKGLNTWLKRLGKGWGYLEISDPDPVGSAKHASLRAIIRPTLGGRKAIAVWQTLMPAIEGRWRERFGNQTVDRLENVLRTFVRRLDPAVPAHFPVLEYEDRKSLAARIQLPVREFLLPELLAKALLAFAAEFDSLSQASLAVCANVLRVTPDVGIPVRDLPRLACLSMFGTQDMLRQLVRKRLGAVGSDSSGSRQKLLMLTPKSRLARDRYLSLAANIEKTWRERFGEDTVNPVRTSLESIVQNPDGTESGLLRGLTPYPDGWRAHLAPLKGLPHFPVVSHRGGFPDGS